MNPTSPHPPVDVAVVGGGPAGLRAAQILSQAGRRVALFDQKASVGRKLLVAGKGGLNLSHSEEREKFVTRYGPAEQERWQQLLAAFSYDDLRAWARDLGIETFIGTSGRLFPLDKKAAPLLVRWTERLKSQGVDFQMEHRWTGLDAADSNGLLTLHWKTPQGPRSTTARAVIFALGGASWPDTGSDGEWMKTARAEGWKCRDFAPANCGWEVAWPASVLAAEGEPVKNIMVGNGERTISGELLITRYGLEGGALYQLGRYLRDLPEPALQIDLKPTFSPEELAARIEGTAPEKVFEVAVKNWKLRPGSAALMRMAWDAEERGDMTPLALARVTKAVRIRLKQPRPISEAISSAGGVAWSGLDAALMLTRQPGVFCAGEMIDWEAPTGGYLLHGCLAQGTVVARGVEEWLRKRG